MKFKQIFSIWNYTTLFSGWQIKKRKRNGKKTGSLAPPFLKFISSQKGIAHSCTSALFAFKAKSINRRKKKSNKKRTEYICLVMTQVSVWLLNMLSTLRVTSYCMCKIFGLYVTHRGERQTVVYNSSQYVYKENKRKKKNENIKREATTHRTELTMCAI